MTIQSKNTVNDLKINKLASMLYLADQGIIVCGFDASVTLDFFNKLLRKKFGDDFVFFQYVKDKEKTIRQILENNLHKKSSNKKGVFSIVYEDIPSYEFLSQIRDIYKTVDGPIIFWFLNDSIRFLQKFAPDFIRARSGLFEFVIADVITHARFLNVKEPNIKDDDKINKEIRKSLLRNYLPLDLNHARRYLELIDNVLDKKLSDKKMAEFVIEILKTSSDLKVDIKTIGDSMRRKYIYAYKEKSMRFKGKDRLNEEQKYKKFCQMMIEQCYKIERSDIAELYKNIVFEIDREFESITKYN